MTEREHQLTAGCLFSGMGGLASGLAKSGFSIRWASDNNEYASATFRHRFPDVRFIEKDVCDLSAEAGRLIGVDLLAAGFPCQSFSQAGARAGFDDERGRLFFEIPRLLGEMEPAQRPPLLMLENVPHLLHGAGGEWFNQVQHELRRAGYWFRDSACLVANVKDHTELPQDRERLFMVAAPKAHFTHNPFSSSVVKERRDERLRPLSAFINRLERGPEDAYLPIENRYYKMINGGMEKGESMENIWELYTIVHQNV